MDGAHNGLDEPLDVRYLQFFEWFNRTEYYEAHEVLEDLWHEARRANAPETAFYKALIQVAGAFCHLKWHFADPTHPAHSRRLAPAGRLFRTARDGLEPFQPVYATLNLAVVEHLCLRYIYLLTAFGPHHNPWFPEAAPQILLEPASETTSHPQ